MKIEYYVLNIISKCIGKLYIHVCILFDEITKEKYSLLRGSKDYKNYTGINNVISESNKMSNSWISSTYFIAEPITLVKLIVLIIVSVLFKIYIESPNYFTECLILLYLMIVLCKLIFIYGDQYLWNNVNIFYILNKKNILTKIF